MSNTARDYYANSDESALEKIQEAVIKQEELQADDIIQALAEDVTRGIAICPVHFTRFVTQNELISRAELHVMIKILGTGMTSTTCWLGLDSRRAFPWDPSVPSVSM